MIWKQSTRIGCAKVVCRSGDTFVSCNYDPPGNFVGEKPF
ncbi:Pathogenesis-related protein 1 [Linum grandiflorum]